MSRDETDRSEICFECNLYNLTCDGQKLFKLEPPRKACINRVQDPQNTESPIQVKACQSLFKTKIRGDMSNMDAFVESITQTSDDVFEKADKQLIEQYENL